MNGLTPDYLSECVPPLVQDTTAFNLRNSNDMKFFHANTNLLYNSFSPLLFVLGIPILRTLSKRDTPVASFKYRLNINIKIWLVDCFGFNGSLRQYFSLYRAVSQKKRKEKR